jgi:hypothetical protein
MNILLFNAMMMTKPQMHSLERRIEHNHKYAHNVYYVK